MNNIIIIAYVLAVIFLFIFINSSLQSRFKIRITWKNILTAGVVVFVIFILGGKILVLGHSSTVIEPEIIAPSHMTPSGKVAMERLFASPDARSSLDKCAITHNCPSEEDSSNSSIMTLAHDLIFASENPKATVEWLRKNSISVDAVAAWRGHYLHHYNTILYPAREVLDGDYKFLLSSQYGLASILPVLFAKDQPFIIYPLAGLVVLLLFFLLVIFKHRHSIDDTVIYGVIFTLIAFTCNVGALKLSPGFSFFRYFPILILLYLSKKHINNQKIKYSILTAIVALFNSIQFNLLALLIVLAVFSAISLGRRINIKIFSLPIVLGFIIGVQFLCYITGFQAFEPELFGSVGEGQQSILYTSLILLFPIVALFLKFVYEKENKVVFSNTEILAYISYGALATYPIAFAGSPQHYAGFLQMACLSIFLIIKYTKWIIYRGLLLSLLFLPPYIFNYLQTSSEFSVSKSSFYNYYGKLGHQLYFRTPTNVSAIADEYHSLVAKYANNKKVYFLSKDKVFIENYLDKNLEPKTYDVFANFSKFSPSDTLAVLSKKNVDFVILDSETHRTNIRNFIRMSKDTLPAEEFRNHTQLLSDFNSFAELIKSNLIACNDRYCIYRVTRGS